MLEFVNNIVVLLFILFLLFIFRGYHLNRLKQMDSETGTEKKQTSSDSSQD